MARRVVGAVAVVCLLVGAEPAMAIGEGPDPDIDPTTEKTLTVTAPSDGGTITGTAPVEGGTEQVINCPEDCSATVATGTTVTLSASRPGWEPDWDGCTSEDVQKRCAVKLTLNKTVGLTWIDVTAPTVAFPSNAPTRVGPFTDIRADAADNVGVTHVQFEVSGMVFDRDQTGPAYTFRAPRDDFVNGATYTVTVRARDAVGNASTATHEFTYDSFAGLDAITTSPALTRCAEPYDVCPQPRTAAVPTFTFDAADDTRGITCYTEEVGFRRVDFYEDGLSTLGCSPDVPVDTPGETTYDGVYRTLVIASDGLSNEVYLYEWTLDRRPPVIQLPWLDGAQLADGAIVKAPFTVTASRQPEEVICKIDSVTVPSCQDIDPADGQRTLTVTARDAVGNSASVTRSFKYDTETPQAEITSGPREGALLRTRTVTFGFTASDTATSITKTCKLDQSAFGRCTAANGHTLSGLTPGIHTFALKVVDQAGREKIVTRQFVTDDPFPAQEQRDQADPTPNPGPGAGTNPGGQPEPQPLPIAAGRSVPKFAVRGGRTRIKKLTVTGLTRGAVVEVSCRGKGCPRDTRKFTASKSTLNLTRLFKKRALRAKAKIEIRVIQDGHVTRVFRYLTQKGRRKPKLQSLCLPAGASKPAACS